MRPGCPEGDQSIDGSTAREGQDRIDQPELVAAEVLARLTCLELCQRVRCVDVVEHQHAGGVAANPVQYCRALWYVRADDDDVGGLDRGTILTTEVVE